MIKHKNPIPDTPAGWLNEITLAFADARETIPVSMAAGGRMSEADLYHLAPTVCLKFRDIKRTQKVLKQATESALSSYLATNDANPEILSNPFTAFAFCYLCSHFGLDLINADQFNNIMEYVEKEIADNE